MRSIIQEEKDSQCFLCAMLDNDYSTRTGLEKHHIYGGPNRTLSEREGLYVYLCHQHHNEPPDGVHYNRRNMNYLHEIGQEAWVYRQQKIKGCTRREAIGAFMKIFGINFLD